MPVELIFLVVEHRGIFVLVYIRAMGHYIRGPISVTYSILSLDHGAFHINYNCLENENYILTVIKTILKSICFSTFLTMPVTMSLRSLECTQLTSRHMIELVCTSQ